MSKHARRIVLRPRVEQDLEQQTEYLEEQASSEVADRYLVSEGAAFEMLAQMPGMGALRENLNARLTGLRMLPVPDFPRYLIFYRATDEDLEIIRVLHSSQNTEGIVREEF